MLRSIEYIKLKQIASLNANRNKTVILALALFYIIFIWTWKINSVPGLHGDEAWSGLSALDGYRGWLGMNNYTGIIQLSLVKLSFTLFGEGVIQLRLPGILLNLIGLSTLSMAILKIGNIRVLIVFFGLFLCSVMLSTSARIAWEVNTMTLVLISILFYCGVVGFRKKDADSLILNYVFLITNIIGTYNHIIFSSIAIALWLSVMIWTLRWRDKRFNSFVILCTFNVINVFAVFLLMRYCRSIPLSILSISLLLLLPLRQLGLIRRLSLVQPRFNLRRLWAPAYFLLSLGVGMFIFFHGIAFLQLLQNTKVLLQLFSFETSSLFAVLSWTYAIVFSIYMIRFVFTDINTKVMSLVVLFLFIYMAVITVYTQNTSFRYYLIFYIVLSLYLSFTVDKYWKHAWPFFAIIVIYGIWIQGTVLQALKDSNFPVKAHDFTIGNGQKETSAHFLRKEPVVQFLRDNKIENIIYDVRDPYFISYPVMFYQKINGWPTNPENTGVIYYNYLWYTNGFITYKVE